MDGDTLRVNRGKSEIVSDGKSSYHCYALKTRVITHRDGLIDVVRRYAAPHLRDGDILFVSEKMVACTQGRAIETDAIRPGAMACLLSRFVTKSPAGIGLGMPETMQCAIDECGALRILLASAAGLLGKLLRKKGWFYRVAGERAAGIDGPCAYTLPPYNRYVVLAPERPDDEARRISESLGGIPVLIVDINDLGGRVLGSSGRFPDRRAALRLLGQNPLGQSDESTPMGILRPAEGGAGRAPRRDAS